jgi:hypothetical protein
MWCLVTYVEEAQDSEKEEDKKCTTDGEKEGKG